MALISSGDAKTSKGEYMGYITGILYMVPDKKLCPFSSKGCFKACLNTAGRGAMNSVQYARQKRADLWHKSKEAFCIMLSEEIEKLDRKAKRKGVKLCIRLNGTSDIVWEQVRQFDGKNVFDAYPHIQFYDYTPNYMRFRTAHYEKNIPANYHMTFSLKEDNKEHALNVLSQGHNVAVVFRDELPDYWQGKRVIDGDKHDLRFLDCKNVVIGLKAKGKARKDTSGFVQDGKIIEKYEPMMQGVMA